MTIINSIYEGSIAPLGTNEDWTEPCDTIAPTPYVAAQKILSIHGENGEIESHEEVQVCVREINLDGDPISDWQYFKGKTWSSWHSNITETL